MTRPDYIRVRIEQLTEDRDKANSNYDTAWYSRLIQELDWADQMITGKLRRNCCLPTPPCDTE